MLVAVRYGVVFAWKNGSIKGWLLLRYSDRRLCEFGVKTNNKEK